MYYKKYAAKLSTRANKQLHDIRNDCSNTNKSVINTVNPH